MNYYSLIEGDSPQKIGSPASFKMKELSAQIESLDFIDFS